MSSFEDIPESLKTQAAADWIRKMGEEAATSALADMAVVQEARAKAAGNVGAYAEPDVDAYTDYVGDTDADTDAGTYTDTYAGIDTGIGLSVDPAMDSDVNQYDDVDEKSWMGGGESQTVSDAMLVVGCCTIITAVVSAIFP